MPATVKDSKSTIASDPLRNFRFHVNIPHAPGGGRHKSLNTMGFMSASGFNVTTEVIAYRQGGFNTTPQKMPGQSDFAPITLSRGLIMGSPQALRWMKEIFSVIQGKGLGSPKNNFRSNFDVKILAHPDNNDTKVHVKAWIKVYNAWPMSFALGDLDAGGNAIVVESMTLAHEGWGLNLASNSGIDLTKYKDTAYA